MSNLKIGFPYRSVDVQKGHTVNSWTDSVTGIVVCEDWFDNETERPDRADGPARIMRNAITGLVTVDRWFKDGEEFEPAAEVRAAWLHKSGEEIAPPSGVAATLPSKLRGF